VAFFIYPTHLAAVEHEPVFTLIGGEVSRYLVLRHQDSVDVVRMDARQKAGAIRGAGGFGYRQEVEVITGASNGVGLDIDIERRDTGRSLCKSRRLHRVMQFQFEFAAIVNRDL